MQVHTPPQRRSHLISTLCLLAALLIVLNANSASATPQSPADIIRYVDADATGNGTGTSWANAFTTLHAALAAAQSGDEIWVAAGVYTPEDKEASLVLVDGVAIYGGFSGDETARDQRDWQANPTILSGDVDGNDRNADGNFISEETSDILGDNAGPVVTSNDVGASTRLDGVIITGGSTRPGAGMRNQGNSRPTLANVTFIGNTSGGSDGGGMHNSDSSPLLRNVHFLNNSAARGAGMYNQTGSSPTLIDVLFQHNRVSQQGGGMANANSNTTLINVAFLGNHADGEGGGLNVGGSAATLVNVLFVGNTTDSPGGGALAIVEQGTVSIINSTFVGNQANGTGGGIYTYNNQPTLRNTVMWNNGGSDRAHQISGETGTIQHSLIQGDSNTDNGNLDGTAVTPGFVRMPDPGSDGWLATANNDYGDLRPGGGSPLLDKGNNAALPADAQDLDGDGNTGETLPLDLGMNARVYNGTVDIGAYEYGLYHHIFVPTVRR